MNSVKASLVLLLFASMLTGGCASATPLPQPSPTASMTPAAAVTVALPPEATPTPSQPDYLDELHMMEATSGWAWAVHEGQDRFLAHTSDGGRTWTGLRPQGNTSSALQPYLAYPLDGRTAWVILGDSVLVRTSNGGQTWETLNPDLQSAFVVPYHDWYLLRFADARQGWLDVGYSAAGAHEFFYETKDGGVTWLPMKFESWPFENHNDHANELAFWTVIDFLYYDASRFLIAPAEQEGTLQMFLSTDLGHSWKTVRLPPEASPVPSFDPLDRHIAQPVFFEAQNGALVVTTREGSTGGNRVSMYGTSDGGLTWKPSGDPSVLHDTRSEITILSPREAVCVCGVQLCKTGDGGSTWQARDFGVPLLGDPDHTHFHLDFIDPMTGWLLVKTNAVQGVPAGSRLLRTDDGGLTWTELALTINP